MVIKFPSFGGWFYYILFEVYLVIGMLFLQTEQMWTNLALLVF